MTNDYKLSFTDVKKVVIKSKVSEKKQDFQ